MREKDTKRKRERETDFKELAHQLWGLARIEFIKQSRRLEIQKRIDISVLSLKSIGWKIGQYFCFEAELFLLQELSVFALRTFNRLYEAHPCCTR
jgi:hypothetical protein